MVVMILWLSVLLVIRGVVGDPTKYAPALVMRCGKATQHRDINTGEWMSGDSDCISGAEQLLDYCKKVYKDLTITNTLEEEDAVNIAHWCHVGSSPPCRGHGHSVKPVRCVVGQYAATPLEVEEGCTFHHEVDHLRCFSPAYWRNTASDLCRAKGKTMATPNMWRVCDEPNSFHGVQFQCCQHPQLSTPKPQKGKKIQGSMPRSAVVNKQPDVAAICLPPKEVGNCRAAFSRWFYNTVSHSCELFTYGGCGGNTNNFETEQECLSICITPEMDAADIVIDHSLCGLPPSTGPCRAAFQKFYYDVKQGSCQPFIYGGCAGNDNQFDMKDDCEKACAGYQGPSDQEKGILSPGTGLFIRERPMNLQTGSVSTSTRSTTTTASTATTTTTAGTATKADTTTEYAKPHTDETTLDTEHDAFAKALDQIKTEHQDKVNEVLAQWESETAILDADAKAQKEDEIQVTMTAIEEEYTGRMNSLNKLHMDKMDTMFRQERSKTLQQFINALTAKKPRMRHIVGSLESYVSIERKDKSHILQHYNMAIRDEFDQESVPDFKLRISEIDARISKTRTALNDHPTILSRIQVEVDEILVSMPDTPDFDVDDEDLINGEEIPDYNRCTLPKVVGACKALFTSFYFDTDVNMCKEFGYGGCGGNENRFETLEACQLACPGESPEENDIPEVVVMDPDMDDDSEDEIERESVLDESVDRQFDLYGDPIDVKLNDPAFLASNHVQEASTGLSMYLVLGMVGGVAILVVIAIVAAVKRNRTRLPTKIVVDKPNNKLEKELTPEEKQLLALQQNGYENPTYKLLEKHTA